MDRARLEFLLEPSPVLLLLDITGVLGGAWLGQGGVAGPGGAGQGVARVARGRVGGGAPRTRLRPSHLTSLQTIPNLKHQTLR